MKKNGNIINASACPELSEKLEMRSFSHVGEIIPIEKLHLPSAFYLTDLPYERISAKIEEYNSNGDFINPCKVKKANTGYQVIDCFDQFLAAQELNLAECRCLVVPN